MTRSVTLLAPIPPCPWARLRALFDSCRPDLCTVHVAFTCSSTSCGTLKERSFPRCFLPRLATMATIRTQGTMGHSSLPHRARIPVEQLPFTAFDPTAGSEDELQAVVIGSPDDCDLPLSIRNSRFFHNIARRSASGEAPRRTLSD